MRDGINTGKGRKHARKGNKGLYSGRYKKKLEGTLQKNWPQPTVLQKCCGLQTKSLPGIVVQLAAVSASGVVHARGASRGGTEGAAPRGLPKGTYRAGAMRLLRTAAGTQGEDLGWRRLRRAPRVILTDRHHIHSAMASPQTCHCCNTLADR